MMLLGMKEILAFLLDIFKRKIYIDIQSLAVKLTTYKVGKAVSWVTTGHWSDLGELKLASRARAKEPPTEAPAKTCNHPCQALISDNNTCTLPPPNPFCILHPIFFQLFLSRIYTH